MSDDVKVKLPTWEILAVIIGYVSTVKDIPEIINTILAIHPLDKIPISFSQWTMGGYAGLLIVLSSILLVKENYKRDEKNSVKTDKDDLQKIIRKMQFTRYLKSLGMDLFFDMIRHLSGIFLYDAFIRPNDWGKDNDTFKSMYRLWMIKNKSYEIRIRKDFCGYNLRIAEDEKFGETKSYSFFRLENKFLAFISFKIFVYTLLHIMLFPFYKCTKNSFKKAVGALFVYALLISSLFFYWPALKSSF